MIIPRVMANENIFTKLRNLKIDWLNHFVGFLSALLGIYIAFRLENYRETEQELAKTKVIERTIWAEINNNIKIYEENVEKLSGWLEYYHFNASRRQESGLIAIGKNELSYITSKYPNRYKALKMEKEVNDTLALYGSNTLLDVVPTAGITTSSWRAGETSGLLNSMDYELVHNLSKIYEWVEKEIGPTDKDFYNSIIGNRMTDIETVVGHYSVIVKSQELKLQEIKRILEEIKWTEDWDKDK
ncbi:MAG TPA: hypothetical protein VFU05_00970 [Cyclobacteriaceae bacterium]|nr:hypothetical protein [Cyclobacteriaceae bacterium]